MQIENLVAHIRLSSRELVRELGFLNNRFSTIGSISQCHALVELDSQGVMNMEQLSSILNLDKSTTSRIVAKLIEKDIFQIQLDENDRRSKLISLTKKGKQTVNQIHLDAILQVQQALNIMSEDERLTVSNGLSTYAKALKRARIHQEYTIRKLHKNDIPQLIYLIKNIWAEFGFDSNHPNAAHFHEELHGIYESFSINKSGYFVLLKDKRVMGGGGFGPLVGGNTNTCEIKGMYLSPQLRGLGLGASLLEKIIEEGKNKGYKKYYLETMDFMHGANALYGKFGFKKLEKPLGNTGHTWTNCFYYKEI